jgi:tRNA A-37 threonylcarbamoyl transferase component Bud32|tara:strand:+ start:163 stop:927 length:765 start_codon:yes stop_codon:yes gene_type:complete
MKLIKKLKGNSGALVELVEINSNFYIKKTNGTKLKKSAEILQELKSQNFNTPDIISCSNKCLIMEYINGVDMQSFLENADNNKIFKIIDFINSYIKIKRTNKKKNFSNEIYNKINSLKKKINQKYLVFSLDQLYKKLPKICIDTSIHGDLTLDNIILKDDKFYLIDANPTDITALEYDVIKIRQDLDCLWFVRDFKNKNNFKIICDTISLKLKKNWSFFKNDYILIFMLLRIFPYTKDISTQKFLLKNMNNLWQ